MRLGFDLDGTVADLQSALAREARRLFPDVDPGNLPKSLTPDEPGNADGEQDGAAQLSFGSLTSPQQRELWRVVCRQHNFWETLDEIEPGALKRLYEMVVRRKWELIFLTSRPETEGDTAQAQSFRWLKSKGYETPSIFVVHGSRGKIAAAMNLDVLVDDRPENCLDVAVDSSARAILVWPGDEAKVPGSARQLGIGAVASISQCLDILEQIEQPDPEGGGMIDRLKRLLGLKPRATRPRGQSRSSSSLATSIESTR